MIDSTSIHGATPAGDPRLARAVTQVQEQKQQQETRPGPQANAPAPKESAKLDRDELESLVQELNLKVPNEHGLRFQVSGDSHELVVQVIDEKSDEVVREIPPDHLNGLRRHFKELTGHLLDDYA